MPESGYNKWNKFPWIPGSDHSNNHIHVFHPGISLSVTKGNCLFTRKYGRVMMNTAENRRQFSCKKMKKRAAQLKMFSQLDV